MASNPPSKRLSLRGGKTNSPDREGKLSRPTPATTSRSMTVSTRNKLLESQVEAEARHKAEIDNLQKEVRTAQLKEKKSKERFEVEMKKLRDGLEGRLHDDLEKLKAEKGKVEDQLEDYKRTAKRYANENSNHHLRIEALEKELASRVSVIERFNEQVARIPAAEAQIEELTEQLRIDREAHRKITGQRNEEVTDLKKRLSEAQSQLTANAQLLREVEKQRDEAQELAEKVTSTEAANQHLAAYLATARDMKASMEVHLSSQIESLEHENRDLKRRNAILETRLEEQEAQTDMLQELETQVESLDEQLANAVSESRSKDSIICELEEKVSVQSDTINELQIISEYSAAQGDIPSIIVTPDAGSSDMEIGDVIQPTTVEDPQEEVEEQKMIGSGTQTTGTLKHVVINISINPEDRKNWSLLQRARAAISRQSIINIQGPPDLVAELHERMKELQADHEATNEKVQELRKYNRDNLMEIGRLRARGGCMVPRHRNVEDESKAKDVQISIQKELIGNLQDAIGRMKRQIADVEMPRVEQELQRPVSTACSILSIGTTF